MHATFKILKSLGALPKPEAPKLVAEIFDDDGSKMQLFSDHTGYLFDKNGEFVTSGTVSHVPPKGEQVTNFTFRLTFNPIK